MHQIKKILRIRDGKPPLILHPNTPLIELKINSIIRFALWWEMRIKNRCPIYIGKIYEFNHPLILVSEIHPKIATNIFHPPFEPNHLALPYEEFLIIKTV